MANLQTIMAETSKSYDNSRNALNNQINAISGDLAAQQGRINAQYAQQAKSLDNQRNYQAQASSMGASRNGGSFGGSAEIANKKYYQQAYVPAVTQMQTNQANDLSSAETQANQNRLSLQQTLASLNDEANRYALQRYDAAVQAEKEEAYRQAQLAEQKRQFDAQMAQQRAYQNYLINAQKAAAEASKQTYKNWDFGNGYSVKQMPSGVAAYYKNGKMISAGDFLEGTAKNVKWDLWNDIWGNGVKTTGVGGDTISHYANTSQIVNMAKHNADKKINRQVYSYLY